MSIKMSEKISVCIPTYNGEEYLRECLDSALYQTYYNTEILIVDDCSSDGTMIIAQEYAALDDRIRIVQNKKNAGLVGNWENCIREASGDWIKFLFQDDILTPTCLEKMYTACIRHESPIAVCRRNFIIEFNADPAIRSFFQKDVVKAEQLIEKQQLVSGQDLSNLVNDRLLNNFLGEPTSLFFHKKILKQYGSFSTELSQMLDYEFTIRVATNTGFVFLPETLAYFRVHGGAESNKNRSDDRAEAKRVKIEYVDKLILLHEMKYSKHFANFREHAGMDKVQEKIRGEFLKGLDQIGHERLGEALKPFLKKYKGLEAELAYFEKTYNEEFVVA